ncbi:hypothetical protein M427DRAFT_58866 [Gonapodya prolifera JEL478]|uniref:Uncharacterized protein n=1 Tax=Gonapodya prolifera (strain JEL478) TaxID=1344416 RepID=A0A139A8M1_GONPJ|nr:hypothetical protein M427DRAFT_58866 [Gonapodya prolifera JEL478]|eukprot:KXS13146.1 hypothetical protein M427DRAFT_58866 [Gonapodya prolifera JEL478]
MTTRVPALTSRISVLSFSPSLKRCISQCCDGKPPRSPIFILNVLATALIGIAENIPATRLFSHIELDADVQAIFAWRAALDMVVDR